MLRLPFEEALMRNVLRFTTIENERLPAGLTDEQVVSRMRRRSQKNRSLMEQTNALIETHIKPVMQNPGLLSDEQADAYADLATQLFTLQQHVDIGLAFMLHRALLNRARELKDVDREIRHLYWQGIIYMVWSRNTFVREARESFEQALKYLPGYLSFENRDTRMLLNRCLGNEYVIISQARHEDDDDAAFFTAVDEALAFWNDQSIRARDPDFPWAAFIANSHQNVCSWTDMLRGRRAGDEVLARRVYESAQYLYGDEAFFNRGPDEQDASLWPNSRTVYMISAAQYHVGLISAREMVGNMTVLVEAVGEGDYSHDGMYVMLHTSMVALDYLQRVPGITQEELRRAEAPIIDKVHRYLQNMPRDTDRYEVNRLLSQFIPALVGYLDIDECIELLLRFATFGHIQTHAHSLMTSRIMVLLCEYFLVRQPARFIGICGARDEAQALEKKEEILEAIRLAGLAHDIGKVSFIQTISTCSRKLIDQEFAIIRQHPEYGYKMVEDSELGEMALDIIRGHHLWHDGSQGYPQGFDNTASPYRFFLDITAVADSIDAATDGIGRSYAGPKTLDEVVAEIAGQAGTRYSPDVAAALADEALRGPLEELLTAGRREAYFAAYQALEGQ